MTAPTTDRLTVRRLYLYGLVPPDARPPGGLSGVAGRSVEVVALTHVGALASDAPTDREIGLPDDLRAHARVLDAVAAETPVLPLRFGTTAAGDVLDAALPVDRQSRHEAALRSLAGTVQLTVSARYREDAVLTRLVAEDAEIRHLREVTRGRPEAHTYAARLRLGELVVAGIDRRRAEDEQRVVATVAPRARAVRAREVTRTGDVTELALLVRREDVAALEEALEELAARVADHMVVRLVGPQAPYDFAEEV